ncbi:MAG: DNA polymerase III subunit delta' [Microbacteriaceae bacterium]|nr:DNA polymerase III subunit delta' [Microbacteriaceae bacterium]
MVTAPRVFRDVISQPEAVTELLREIEKDSDVHHAWLFTGPPGSGRSELAFAFAAALVCSDGGCGSCNSCQMVEVGNHPDVQVLNTEKVQISIDEVSEFIEKSLQMPAIANYRIMIVEDADRMSERTSNLFLKSLEEPPKGTIWMLCAPSEADLLPTIRSRVRRIMLKVPAVADVARLLVEKYDVDEKLAMVSASQAQSHVGMARRLATNASARDRRRQVLELVLSIVDVPTAVAASEKLLKLAESDGAQLTGELDEQERVELMQRLGVTEDSKLTPSSRAQLRKLEEAQKKRSTRSKRDGLDRIFVDLMGFYRDVLSVQLNSGQALINPDLAKEIGQLATDISQAQAIHIIDKIEQVRYRMDRNVKDSLLMDSLCVAMRRKKRS